MSDVNRVESLAENREKEKNSGTHMSREGRRIAEEHNTPAVALISKERP